MINRNRSPPKSRYILEHSRNRGAASFIFGRSEKEFMLTGRDGRFPDNCGTTNAVVEISTVVSIVEPNTKKHFFCTTADTVLFSPEIFADVFLKGNLRRWKRLSEKKVPSEPEPNSALALYMKPA